MSDTERQRDSFVFYRNWWESLKTTPEIRHEVLDAVMSKVFDGKTLSVSPLAQMALSFILPAIERDVHKYDEIVEKRRQAGRMGGLKTQANAKQNKQIKQMVANASKAKQIKQVQANQADNVNELSNDNNNNIINTHTNNAHEDEFFSEAFENETWREAIRMRHKLTEQQVTDLWEEFKLHSRASNKEHHGARDIQEHFNLWLLNRNEKVTKGSENNIRTRSATLEVGTEFKPSFDF